LKTKIVFWFSLQIYLKHRTFSEEFREILSQLYIGLHVKCQFFSPLLMKFDFFLTDSLKKRQIPNFIEILPVGAVFFPWGRTDRNYEAISRFLHFSNAPKIYWLKWNILQVQINFVFHIFRFLYIPLAVFLWYKQAPRFRNAMQNAIQLLTDLIGIKWRIHLRHKFQSTGFCFYRAFHNVFRDYKNLL
jgi:hypothetical protein